MDNTCRPQASGAASAAAGATPGEKRKLFDALTPVEVSSVEVRNIPRDGGGFVAKIVRWLDSIGVIGNYKNNDIGMDNIAVNRRSVENVIYHGAGYEKMALLEAVPDLIENGVHLETNKENDLDLKGYIFASKATIDGKQYAVGYVVREDGNGRRYYDHELTALEEIDALEETGEESRRTPNRLLGPGANPAGKESVINILKKHLWVNR